MILYIIKGILFSSLLLIAAVCDLRNREIPNSISLGMLAVGMIGITPLSFLYSLLGLIIAALPYFAVDIVSKRNRFPIGGGDIKLMAGCGFVLGVGGGILQNLIALPIAIIYGMVITVIEKIKFNEESIPLAPFICVGGMLVYFRSVFL